MTVFDPITDPRGCYRLHSESGYHSDGDVEDRYRRTLYFFRAKCTLNILMARRLLIGD